ncbi:MAG: response regulator [Pseudomonadota bacterium]
MTAEELRVLAVDDDPDVAEMLSLALIDVGGLHARVVTSVEDAMATLADFTPTLLVIDAQLGNVDGIAFAEQLTHMIAPTPPWILLTGNLDRSVEERARAYGAARALAKPFSPATFADELRDVARGS